MSGTASTVVAFVGSTPNIGTTSAAVAAACRVAEYSGAPVGYLCLNLKSSKLHCLLGIERPAVTLDVLRPELRARTLTPDKLLRSMHRMPHRPQLHILFGNQLRDQAEYYMPEDIEHLITVASSAFKVLFVDVSSYWDNAATITALGMAHSRILVTTTAFSHFQEDAQRWIGQTSPLFGIPPHAYELVLVHPPWRNGGYRQKDIRRETGLAMIGDMKLTEQYMSHLDSGRLDRWLAGDEQGKRAMSSAAEHLMAKHAMRKQEGKLSQPWFRKLLSHRNEVGL